MSCACPPLRSRRPDRRAVAAAMPRTGLCGVCALARLRSGVNGWSLHSHLRRSAFGLRAARHRGFPIAWTQTQAADQAGRSDRRRWSATWRTSAAILVRPGSWVTHASARLVIASARSAVGLKLCPIRSQPRRTSARPGGRQRLGATSGGQVALVSEQARSPAILHSSPCLVQGSGGVQIRMFCTGFFGWGWCPIYGTCAIHPPDGSHGTPARLILTNGLKRRS